MTDPNKTKIAEPMNHPTPPTAPAPLHYPPWLEAWWMARAKDQLPEGTSITESLREEVQLLSDLFTKQREQEFARYGQAQRSQLAYGLYYFPQTFVRTRFPLLEAQQRGWQWPAQRPLRILDLGAGLGAASVSLVHWLEQHENLEVIDLHALDHAAQSLHTLEALSAQLSEHWPRSQWTFTKGNLTRFQHWPQGPWDLIVASFSLNEAFHDTDEATQTRWLSKALKRLSPQGIFLLLEPILHQHHQRIERWRDALLADQNVFVWGPCPHQLPCPMRTQQKNACHEVRPWQPPTQLEHINRKLHRSIQTLKFGYLLLSPQPPPPPTTHTFRLVSPTQERRGLFSMQGCNHLGQLHTYEILKRHLDKTQLQQLRTWNRGDTIQTPNPTTQTKQATRLTPNPHTKHYQPH